MVQLRSSFSYLFFAQVLGVRIILKVFFKGVIEICSGWGLVVLYYALASKLVTLYAG